MIKIKIITLGKLKEDYLRGAFSEYEKRLKRYCNLEIVELNPFSMPDSPSNAQIENALLSEAKLIESKIPDNYFLTALCVEGKELSSEMFAKKIKEKCNMGQNLCFVIGSSFGLSDKIKQKADLRLSVSKMTFPHQLFRIILLEQIYRAFKINEGSTYHK